MVTKVAKSFFLVSNCIGCWFRCVSYAHSCPFSVSFCTIYAIARKWGRKNDVMKSSLAIWLAVVSEKYSMASFVKLRDKYVRVAVQIPYLLRTQVKPVTRNVFFRPSENFRRIIKTVITLQN